MSPLTITLGLAAFICFWAFLMLCMFKSWNAWSRIAARHSLNPNPRSKDARRAFFKGVTNLNSDTKADLFSTRVWSLAGASPIIAFWVFALGEFALLVILPMILLTLLLSFFLKPIDLSGTSS